MADDLLDPHWALLPEYRIEGVWRDGEFSVTRADDRVVLSQQFLDDLAMGLSRVDATLDIRACECGRRCFHGAIMVIEPRGLALTYRVSEQIEHRCVWWAERITETASPAASPAAHAHAHSTAVVVAAGRAERGFA